MPQIPMITAEGRGVTEGTPGVLRGRAPGPQALGYQVGQGLTELGRSFTEVADKLQYQQDQLDVVGKAGDYNVRLAEARREIMLDGNLKTADQRLLAYKKRMQEFGKELLADANPAVSRTLQRHMMESLSHGMIQLRSEDLTRQLNGLRADLSKAQERSADVEGMALATGDQDGALRARTERLQLLESAKAFGTINDMEAMAEDDRATNRTWELVATRNPDYMLKLYGNHLAGEAPPAGMDTQKFGHYAGIARGVINARSAQSEKEQAKLVDEQIRGIHGIMWGTPDTGGGRDASIEINQIKGMLTAKQYEDLLKDNKALNDARVNPTADQKRFSQYNQTYLFDLAKRAKYQPDLLSKEINEDIVKAAVFTKKSLLPEDATMIFTAIAEARAHHESGDSALRKAQTDAMHSLEVYVPMQSDPSDAFTLKNIQDTMQRQLRLEMDAKPNATPQEIQEMANNIRANGEMRILGAQKRNLAQVDEQLMGMELMWREVAPGLSDQHHKLDPKMRTQLEEQFPLFKGMFKLYDKRVERYEQLLKGAQSAAEPPSGGKKSSGK